MIQEFVLHGGTQEQQPDSVCAISAWHVPGGYRYDQARIVQFFFASQEAAEKLANMYSNPPEMALLLSLSSIAREAHRV